MNRRRRTVVSGIIWMAAALLVVGACDSSTEHHARMHGPVLLAGSPAEDENVLGVALTEQFCSRCHAKPSPKVHSANEWPDVIARMLDNMHRSGKSTPGPEQIEAILGYLQANAR